mgnify:CR=1 FL=1
MNKLMFAAFVAFSMISGLAIAQDYKYQPSPNKAEYYFANNQKQKSKEFFQQLANLENASQKIKTEALKRLRVDFGE